MKTALECIPCFVRQAAEVVKLCETEPSRRERLLRILLRKVAEMDWSEAPPLIAQKLHGVIRSETGLADPYRSIKDRMNRMALDLMPSMKDVIRSQPDPREAIVRLAIAGNLLDSGAKSGIEAEALPQRLDTIWNMPLIGNYRDLFREADKAHCILYLADNAGEIVFDRLLIEALPSEKITVAVRGFPTINDATIEDAELAGIPEIAPVIANGSDAPGTMIEECSGEFRYWFDRADLVISKGQGNYETLSDTLKNVFFLLTVKCSMIAEQLQTPIGAFVVKHGGKGE